jgi:enamine deaminase RidA (YjgF/YER057c/UK114 family)
MTDRISSGAPWEPVIGYSRAVRAGDTIYVSGCTATVEGEVVAVGDAYEQTRLALQRVADALARLGADLRHVVRTRMFVTDISRWPDVGRAHGEVFGDIRPATSMVEVSALIDPRMLVEVEAIAWTGAEQDPDGVVANEAACAFPDGFSLPPPASPSRSSRPGRHSRAPVMAR